MAKYKIKERILIQAEVGEQQRIGNLFDTVLGAREVHAESGISVRKVGDNRSIEFYSPAAGVPRYLFQKGNVVVCFRVEDINEAYQKAKLMGFNMLTAEIQVCDSFSYCYLEIGNNVTIGFFQDN